MGADDRVAPDPGARPTLAGQRPRSLSNAPITKLAFRHSHTGTGCSPRAADPGSSAGSGRAPEGSGAAGSAEVIRYLTENHDRIAQRMNDVVVRRIFAAGLDLQAGLGPDRRSQGGQQDLPRQLPLRYAQRQP